MSKIILDKEDYNKVYLQPSTSNRPIKHIESADLAGIIVDAKHALAMYTSRTSPSVGPQGPPGHGFDTIIASASDENTPISTGGPKTTFRAPYALDLSNGYIRCSLTTAPSGAAMVIQLHMNNVLHSTITIDDGMKTSVGSAVPFTVLDTDVPDDAEFLVYVTAVGSGFAGTGLKVAVTGEKVT